VHHWYTSKEKSHSLPTFTPVYSPGITKIYFIQSPTEYFIPSCNISLGPAYAHKLKTSSNIATLANITRHNKRSMDTYLFKTHNKSLTHGTQLQSTPLAGPWIIPQLPHSLKSKEPTTLQAFTIIDLNMHFMEIVALKNKESITITCTLNQVWLCLYPNRLIVFLTMVQNSSPPNFKNFFNHMEFDPN
jgi:hypothetical protein